MKKNSRILSLCVALALLFLTVAILSGLKRYVDKRKTDVTITAAYSYTDASPITPSWKTAPQYLVNT